MYDQTNISLCADTGVSVSACEQLNLLLSCIKNYEHWNYALGLE